MNEDNGEGGYSVTWVGEEEWDTEQVIGPFRYSWMRMMIVNTCLEKSLGFEYMVST